MKPTDNSGKTPENENEKFPGYPLYPDNEDIYRKDEKEEEIDPENPAEKKTPVETSTGRNEKDFDDLVTGDDLDVPGSELDDEDEAIGSEDEENDYYSLGDNE